MLSSSSPISSAWAAPARLYRGAAGAYPYRHDVRLARHAAVVDHQAARELRRHHELRDFPDVLRFFRALSAVEDAGRKPVALLSLPLQSLHLGRRADPLRVLPPDQLAGARYRQRLHGSVPGPLGVGLRSILRHPAAQGGCGRYRLNPGPFCGASLGAGEFAGTHNTLGAPGYESAAAI